MRPRCLRCGSFEVKVWNEHDTDCDECGFGWLKEAVGWPDGGWPMGYETVDEFRNAGWTNVPYGCLAVWGEI